MTTMHQEQRSGPLFSPVRHSFLGCNLSVRLCLLLVPLSLLRLHSVVRKFARAHIQNQRERGPCVFRAYTPLLLCSSAAVLRAKRRETTGRLLLLLLLLSVISFSFPLSPRLSRSRVSAQLRTDANTDDGAQAAQQRSRNIVGVRLRTTYMHAYVAVYDYVYICVFTYVYVLYVYTVRGTNGKIENRVYAVYASCVIDPPPHRIRSSCCCSASERLDCQKCVVVVIVVSAREVREYRRERDDDDDGNQLMRARAASL